jgi:hypothetical protein
MTRSRGEHRSTFRMENQCPGRSSSIGTSEQFPEAHGVEATHSASSGLQSIKSNDAVVLMTYNYEQGHPVRRTGAVCS